MAPTMTLAAVPALAPASRLSMAMDRAEHAETRAVQSARCFMPTRPVPIMFRARTSTETQGTPLSILDGVCRPALHGSTRGLWSTARRPKPSLRLFDGLFAEALRATSTARYANWRIAEDCGHSSRTGESITWTRVRSDREAYIDGSLGKGSTMLARVSELTKKYCLVAQTLKRSPGVMMSTEVG